MKIMDFLSGGNGMVQCETQAVHTHSRTHAVVQRFDVKKRAAVTVKGLKWEECGGKYTCIKLFGHSCGQTKVRN